MTISYIDVSYRLFEMFNTVKHVLKTILVLHEYAV